MNTKITDKLIKNFLVEQLGEISPFFLYKDHQLIKQNRFDEFIERQIDKSRKRYFLGFFILLAGTLAGVYYIWMYMNVNDTFYLFSAIYWFSCGVFLFHWHCKQYFIITGSMSLIKKIVDQKQSAKETWKSLN